MKKLRLFVVLTMTVVLTVTLAACRRAVDWKIDPSVISDNLEVPTSNVTVVVSHSMADPKEGASYGQTPLLLEYIKEFKELYPNITVISDKVDGGYDGLFKDIKARLVAQTEPTMTFAYPDHVASYIKSNRVLPLDNLVNNKNAKIAWSADDIADFYPEFLNEGRAYNEEKNYVSVPYSKSTEAMFYNKTVFDNPAFGLTVPKTWEDVEATSKQIFKLIDEGKLVLPEGTKRENVYPFGYGSGPNLFIVRGEQEGAPYTKLGENLTGEILLNNEKSKNMMKEIKRLYDGKILATDDAPSVKRVSDKLKAGESYMVVGSTGGANYNVTSNFDTGVAPVPQVDVNNPKSLLQGPSVVFFQKENVDEMVAGWLFYKYVTEAEQTIRQAVGTGYLPLRKSAYELDAFTKMDVISARGKIIKATLDIAKDSSSSYFTSPAFDKSANARINVGVLVLDILSGADIDRSFKKAIDEITA
ncbi:extracellular solute-binding protein [Haploplasma axanthum]|uniref:Glycerol-3-phosphate transporter periplasmic binding protein n=1 Tax=Haploplasma axanthum TaxID=29552 RepID=A0A449BC71_HAPAX|nr:extracellular solute-binding protein [Haploplasma axanthum]VEU80051.1 glycerol-3-phosphate transporter periplasmic binding protein [Haploplasma axanthum]